MWCWPHPSAAHVLLFFLLAGWALCLSMWMLFRGSEAVIDRLIIKVRVRPNPNPNPNSNPDTNFNPNQNLSPNPDPDP